MTKRYLGWLFVCAGLGLVAFYIHRLGIDRLLSAFQTMGWGIGILLSLPLFLYFVHTVGWSQTLSRDNRTRIGLFRLTALQTFSYGISGMLPLQIFVSEPLKLAFLKGTDHDKEDFTASLLLDNTINGIAIFAVAAAGLVYLAAVLATELWIRLLFGVLVAACVALFGGLILLQKRGLFTGVLNLLGHLRPLAGFRDRHIEQTTRIDGQVRLFYNENRRGFWLAFLCHVVEKAQGVAEFWVIFRLLGMEVSWGSCFFVFSVTQALDNLLFFVQIGGMEAWVSSTLAWMKITRGSVNITAALFRRVRLLFWALVAVAALGPTRRLFTRDRLTERG